MPILPKVIRARSASQVRLGFAPRRDTATFSSRPAEELGQPQDGAIPASMAVTSSDLKSREPESREPESREPEDARLTGGTRSLMRRVLGLNVTRTALKPVRSASPARGGSALPVVSAA